MSSSHAGAAIRWPVRTSALAGMGSNGHNGLCADTVSELYLKGLYCFYTAATSYNLLGMYCIPHMK